MALGRRIALLLLLTVRIARAQEDPSYWNEDDRWVIRSAGGFLGVGLDNHGAMDLEDFSMLSTEPLPEPPGGVGSYYFGINSSSIGILLGPRITLARERNGVVQENGWNFHMGIDPRFFYQYYYLDSATVDTLFTTEYLYLMGQVEFAFGAGRHWRTRPTRSFYLLGSPMLEVGLAPPGIVSVSGTRTATVDTWEQSTTLLDDHGSSRGCTYLRGLLVGEAGFRIRKRVDLGFRFQWGMGMMWVHGQGSLPILAAQQFLIHAQWLVRR